MQISPRLSSRHVNDDRLGWRAPATTPGASGRRDWRKPVPDRSRPPRRFPYDRSGPMSLIERSGRWWSIHDGNGARDRRRPRRQRGGLAARPRAASRWSCTRCGRCGRPKRTRPTRWPSWSARTRSAPTTPLHNAVGLLHEEMRRCGSLIMRAGDAHKLPAGGALAVDRDGFAAAVQAALEAEPLVEIRREEVPALPAASWGQVIVATGPLTSPALARVDPPVTRRGRARLLRCHRADRAPRDASTWRSPGCSRATTRPGPAAPAPTTSTARWTRRSTRPSSRPLLAGDKPEFKEWGADALFRGLPADRGDGRARPETLRFGPMKPVGPADPRTGRRRTRWCSCARTTRSARCSTWSASRPS